MVIKRTQEELVFFRVGDRGCVEKNCDLNAAAYLSVKICRTVDDKKRPVPIIYRRIVCIKYGGKKLPLSSNETCELSWAHDKPTCAASVPSATRLSYCDNIYLL